MMKRTRKKAPRPFKLFIVGCRGAGKTMFLAGLRRLAGPDKGSFQIRNEDGETRTLLGNLTANLDRGEWPASTSSEHVIEAEIVYEGMPFDLTLVEYPGEDLETSISFKKFEAGSKIESALNEADCLLFLIDPLLDLNFVPLQDPDLSSVSDDAERSARKRRDILLKVAQDTAGGHGANCKRAVIALAKSDRLAPDPKTFQKEFLSRIRDEHNRPFLENLASNTKGGSLDIFPISAVGAVVETVNGVLPKPDAAPPWGYEALFKSLKKQRRAVFFSKPFVLAVAAVASISVAFFGWSLFQSQREDAVDRQTSRQIERAHEILDTPNTSLEDLRDQKERLEELVAQDSRYRTEARDLLDDYENRIESDLFNRVRHAINSLDWIHALEAISKYKETVPQGRRIDDVERHEGLIADRQRDDARAKLRNPVSDGDGLQARADNIRRYMEQHLPDGVNSFRGDLERAAELADILAVADRIRLHPTAAGYSENKPSREFKIAITTSRDRLAVESLSKNHETTFVGKDIEVRRTDWKNMRVEFDCKWIWGIDIGSVDARGKLDILKDLHRLHHFDLETVDSDDDWEAWVRFQVEVENSNGWERLDANDRQLLARFVTRADGW